MKKLFLVSVFALAVQAAEIQVVVRADNGTIQTNTTISIGNGSQTGNSILLAIDAWRQNQRNSDGTLTYPTPESLFRAIMIDAGKRILRQQPSAAVIAEREKAETAKEVEDTLIDSSLQ